MVFSPADIQARPGLVGSCMKRVARGSEMLIRHWPLVWAGLMGLLMLGAAGRASERLLWHDELFTLYASQLSPRRTVAGPGQRFGPAAAAWVSGDPSHDVHIGRRTGCHAGTDAAGVWPGLRVPGPFHQAASRAGWRHRGAVGSFRHGRLRLRVRGAAVWDGPGATGVALLLWQATESPRVRRGAPWDSQLHGGRRVSALLQRPARDPTGGRGIAPDETRDRTGAQPFGWRMAAGCVPLLAYRPLIGAASEYSSLFWTRASFGQVPLHLPLLSVPDPSPAVALRSGVGRVPFAVAARACLGRPQRQHRCQRQNLACRSRCCCCR